LSRAAPTLKPRAVMTPSAIRQPGAISISTRNCQQGPHREESDDGGRRRIDEHSSCAYQDLTHLPLRFRAASPPLTIRRLSPSPSSVPSARRSRSLATSWILFRFPWPGNGYRAVRRAAMAASCSILPCRRYGNAQDVGRELEFQAEREPTCEAEPHSNS
jgi:hypothetical protein